jgi:hypothetical protein
MKASDASTVRKLLATPTMQQSVEIVAEAIGPWGDGLTDAERVVFMLGLAGKLR